MRIIVGVSGASGVAMSYTLCKALRTVPNTEIHLIISDGGQRNWELETNLPLHALTDLAHHVHDSHNLAASISSGSFVTAGMIVLPCSMKTLAGIATGYTDNLLLRAADVCLKEGRKVVLCPREMPLGKVHLRNMMNVSELGCVIVPPMLTFYNGPQSMDDQIRHVVGKILMQFGLSMPQFHPWEGVE